MKGTTMHNIADDLVDAADDRFMGQRQDLAAGGMFEELEQFEKERRMIIGVAAMIQGGMVRTIASTLEDLGQLGLDIAEMILNISSDFFEKYLQPNGFQVASAFG